MNNFVRNDINNKDWLLVALMCACALSINSFAAIQIYGAINIYLGSIFALISMLVLPIRLSVLVLASSLGAFYFQLGSFVFTLVQAIEYIFVLLLIRSRYNFLVAVFLYWGVIGLPSLFSIQYVFGGSDFQTALFMSITIGLNGFICGIFALFIYWFVPSSSQFKRFKPAPPKFANVVFELCIVSVMLPVILVILVFTWRSTAEAENTISAELGSASLQFDNIVTGRIEQNLHTVISAAQTIQALPSPEGKASLLNAIANANDDIESMLVTDKEANVVVVGPEKYQDIFANLKNLSIKERNYFAQTKENNRPFISRVLSGKGLGNLDIVAMTAPITVDGKFNGLVQAATKLTNLVDMKAIETLESYGTGIVVTDSVDAIVYSTNSLALTERTTFELTRTFHPFLRDSRVLAINQQAYIFRLSENQYGWKIYALAPPDKVFASVVNYFLYIGLTLLVSVLLIGLLANRLANKITLPLVNLEKFILGSPNKTSLIAGSSISKEMQAVTKSLISSTEVTDNFKTALKQQVEDKTRELQALNQRLLETSQHDALTKLFNRGAFDQKAVTIFDQCVRHKMPFSVVLADIDFFKNVNDTFGHQTGDQCLIQVANILQNKCRRNTDLVARYGGEEFIFILSGNDLEQQFAFIESIRKEIEVNHITANDSKIKLTISCGIVRVSKDFSTPFERLIAYADEQLYKSKRTGRNKSTLIDM